MPEEIPLYQAAADPEERVLIGFFRLAELMALKGIDFVRNRRGNVTRAMLKGSTALAVDSSQGWVGRGFEQHLSVGRVWALQGVRGSGK